MSPMKAIRRSLSSSLQLTRMWRSTERASLEKKPSMRLSHDPCVGVNVKVKRPSQRCVGLTGTSRSPLAKVVDNDGRLFSTEFVGVYMQSWGGAPPRYAHPSREFARHKKGRQNRSTSVGNQKFESISLHQRV